VLRIVRRIDVKRSRSFLRTELGAEQHSEGQRQDAHVMVGAGGARRTGARRAATYNLERSLGRHHRLPRDSARFQEWKRAWPLTPFEPAGRAVHPE
jgi:hypothetical protein